MNISNDNDWHNKSYQARVKFKRYEENADKTLKQIIFKLYGTTMLLVMFMQIGFAIIDHRRYGVTNYLSYILIAVLFTIVFLSCLIGLTKKRNNCKAISEVENTEGYGQHFIDECDKIKEQYPRLRPIMIGCTYNYLGRFDISLQVLQQVNEDIFQTDPEEAHIYYAVKLEAMLSLGYYQDADNVYQRGLYYLKTYMNSPISGDYVSISLGINEYYRCRYQESIKLLNAASNILIEAYTPKKKLVYEHTNCRICYWKAMNYASLGNKAMAEELLNSTRNLYTTPYYRECINKLFADMANNELEKRS